MPILLNIPHHYNNNVFMVVPMLYCCCYMIFSNCLTGLDFIGNVAKNIE